MIKKLNKKIFLNKKANIRPKTKKIKTNKTFAEKKGLKLSPPPSYSKILHSNPCGGCLLQISREFLECTCRFLYISMYFRISQYIVPSSVRCIVQGIRLTMIHYSIYSMTS